MFNPILKLNSHDTYVTISYQAQNAVQLCTMDNDQKVALKTKDSPMKLLNILTDNRHHGSLLYYSSPGTCHSRARTYGQTDTNLPGYALCRRQQE
jgi:hypothetical protein